MKVSESSLQRAPLQRECSPFFFFNFIFGGPFLKALLNLLQYSLVFCCGLLATRHVDLSSLTRDRTHTPCIGRPSFNHWTTREVLGPKFLSSWRDESRAQVERLFSIHLGRKKQKRRLSGWDW